MLLRGCFALLCCLLASPAWAAVTYDAVSTDTGSTQTSQSHTIAADANLIVIIVGLRDEDGDAEDITSVTVGGEAATLITGCLAETVSTTGVHTEIWAKVSPLTGVQTVIANSVNSEQIQTGAISFKGAALTNTFGTCVTLANVVINAIDLDTIGSAVGEMGVMGLTMSGTTTCAPDGTATVSDERYDFANGVNAQACGYTEPGAATSIDMRADLGANRNVAAAAVSIRPLAASTRRPIPPIFFQ